MSGTANEIVKRLRTAADSGRQIEGLLFHGTCERIEGPLRPGGDGLLWMSDSPAIAQQYIPAAGLEIMCSRPSPYEMDNRVRPDRESVLYRIACGLAGRTVEDVEFDQYGRLLSWGIPDGWPTYRQVTDHVETVLGYAPADSGCYWLRAAVEDGAERVMPADWTMPGTLFVALADGLRLKDIRQGEESDLTLYEHNNLCGFRQAAEEGYDGVVINDFAQTTKYGNLGHRSFGLNERGLSKAEWTSLPAVRFDLDVIFPFPAFTPDLAAWLEGLETEAGARPGL